MVEFPNKDRSGRPLLPPPVFFERKPFDRFIIDPTLRALDGLENFVAFGRKAFRRGNSDSTPMRLRPKSTASSWRHVGLVAIIGAAGVYITNNFSEPSPPQPAIPTNTARDNYLNTLRTPLHEIQESFKSTSPALAENIEFMEWSRKNDGQFFENPIPVMAIIKEGVFVRTTPTLKDDRNKAGMTQGIEVVDGTIITDQKTGDEWLLTSSGFIKLIGANGESLVDVVNIPK